MPRPRSQQVSLETTSYYHCIGRCVRRAFLCGEDELTGRSFEHRRGWIMDRLALLTEVFAIDLYAYAIMSNHYHLVIRISPERSDQWDDRAVARRWMRLYTGPLYVHHWLSNTCPDTATESRALEEIAKWRARLADLSWFMRCLNEHIARRANDEDCCTGHFWEGRFKTQALCDEAAVLRCMTYVDLNPFRAGMTDSPEQGDYTSIRQRVQRLQTSLSNKQTTDCGSEMEDEEANLPRLVDLGEAQEEQDGDPVCPVTQFALPDYLDLVAWTGRSESGSNKRTMSVGAASIMDRIGVDETTWLALLRPKRRARLYALERA